MKLIKRIMTASNEVDTANDNLDEYLPYCQASFNSDGNITLRNYDRSNKNKDEIIILSETETKAIFILMSEISNKIKGYSLPF